MPLHRPRQPLAAVGAGGARGHRFWNRLLEGATGHLERFEHGATHQLRKGHVGDDIAERKLHQRDGAAGILEGLKRRTGKQHLADVGWRFAVENLHQRRPWRRRIVARESKPIISAGGVAHERSRRHRYAVLQIRFGHLPRFENLVHVLIESQRPVLDQTHRRHGRDGLADGGGLKQRGGLNRLPGLDVGDAVSLGPVNLEVADDRDADARHVELFQERRDVIGGERSARQWRRCRRRRGLRLCRNDGSREGENGEEARHDSSCYSRWTPDWDRRPRSCRSGATRRAQTSLSRIS